jgi:hypothetical protein
MATCSTCQKTILFGGKRSGELRFCNDDCLQQGRMLLDAQALPTEIVWPALRELHQGLCPACGGSGPVDVHTSHEVWSIGILTSWKSVPAISCRPCAVKRQVGAIFFCLFLGWWGVPFGLLVTPLQLARNLGGLLRPPDPTRPSPALEHHVRWMLAEADPDRNKPDVRA